MIDFCQVVQDLAKNPKAIPPIKTVAELQLLRLHVASCTPCATLIDQVLQRLDYPSEGIVIGTN